MDIFDGTIVPYLFLATFVIVLVLAVVQFRKARKAQREHHQSAEARAHGERPGERSAASGVPASGPRRD